VDTAVNGAMGVEMMPTFTRWLLGVTAPPFPALGVR
jgi:hypothetical protein